MTDLLGEALAVWDTRTVPLPDDSILPTIVAAARSWHTLTNGDTVDRLARILHRRWYCQNPQPCGTCKADASSVVDALTETRHRP